MPKEQTKVTKELAKQLAIDNIKDRLGKIDTGVFGDILYERITDYDNLLPEMASAVCSAVYSCENAHDFELVNNTICAITGWNIDSLLEMAETRTAEYSKED